MTARRPDTPGPEGTRPRPDAYGGAVPRTALHLAALATVAVPGLDAVDVRRSAEQSAAVDAAVVIDAEGNHWVVRAPVSAGAGAALEAEVALLRGLAAHVDSGALPFQVPRPAGQVGLPEGGRAIVHRRLAGRPLALERLGPGPGLAAALGRALAALHELPVKVVEDAGLPVYDPEAYRRRRLAEVDEAARTGHVPATLLRRWERALEDVAMWRFHPTVVHGDLSADHVLCSGDEPTAVLGWSEAKVADPADDLAWLLVAAPQEAVDPILEAYTLRRTETADRHLAQRALLAGELALARWLLHGVRTEDPEVVADAVTMLEELDEHTRPQPVDPSAAPTWTADPEDAWASVGPEDDAWAPDDEAAGAASAGPEPDGAVMDGAVPDDAVPDGDGSRGGVPDGRAEDDQRVAHGATALDVVDGRATATGGTADGTPPEEPSADGDAAGRDGRTS